MANDNRPILIRTPYDDALTTLRREIRRVRDLHEDYVDIGDVNAGIYALTVSLYLIDALDLLKKQGPLHDGGIDEEPEPEREPDGDFQ